MERQDQPIHRIRPRRYHRQTFCLTMPAETCRGMLRCVHDNKLNPHRTNKNMDVHRSGITALTILLIMGPIPITTKTFRSRLPPMTLPLTAGFENSTVVGYPFATLKNAIINYSPVLKVHPAFTPLFRHPLEAPVSTRKDRGSCDVHVFVRVFLPRIGQAYPQLMIPELPVQIDGSEENLLLQLHGDIHPVKLQTRNDLPH